MEISYLDPFVETLGRDALTQIQQKKFELMLESVLKGNRFYQRKLHEVGVKHPTDIRTLDDLRKLPFTERSELSRDQTESPPYGTNLTFERDRYTRIHQTGGIRGTPIHWLDTEESWRWWTRCWATVFRSAGVTSRDRILFAFSFGPTILFWAAYHGAEEVGALSVPGGGLSSHQRIKQLVDHDITVLVSTPTYALHLAEVASRKGIDFRESNLSITIHSGESGASIPEERERIENALGVRCYDHVGATAVGAWGWECQAQSGVHINEGEFICEVINPATKEPAEEGELVMTNLGRTGMPVIRYRTGDRVKLVDTVCGCGRSYRRLDGGVLGRIDDAIQVRGAMVFPSAIEAVIRRFSRIGEFAIDVYRDGELDDVQVRIEVLGDESEDLVDEVARELRTMLGMRIDVSPVAVGELPSGDPTTHRFFDHRIGRSESQD